MTEYTKRQKLEMIFDHAKTFWEVSGLKPTNRCWINFNEFKKESTSCCIVSAMFFHFNYPHFNELKKIDNPVTIMENALLTAEEFTGLTQKQIRDFVIGFDDYPASNVEDRECYEIGKEFGKSIGVI